MKNNILIAYFSRGGNNYVNGNIQPLAVGNTEVMAKMIQQITGGETFKIEPVKKYSDDYDTCTHEAQSDLRKNARPNLEEYLENIDASSTIFLGYPNYWGTMPMPVYTFLEKYDFSKKVIYPFCTHEGSGLGHSETDIQTLCPTARLGKGLAIRGGDVANARAEIERWIDTLKL